MLRNCWCSLGLHTCWMLRNCWCSLGLHTCWMLRNCWCSLGLHTCWMLRNCWCTCWMLRNCWWGLGWGGVGIMMFFGLAYVLDVTELLMFCGLAYMLDATELLMFFGLACMLDATELLMFFGLAYMLDATELLMFFGLAYMLDTTERLMYMLDATELLMGVGVGWGGDNNVLWACIHVGCYGTADVLMPWLRCWQWRYESSSDDLLKTTGQKLRNLWRLRKMERRWNLALPECHFTRFFLNSTKFRSTFSTYFPIFHITGRSASLWKLQCVCNLSQCRVSKRSRGFQSAGMFKASWNTEACAFKHKY